MKKQMILFGILLLVLWGLAGCSVSGESEIDSNMDNESGSSDETNVSVQFGESDREDNSVSDGDGNSEIANNISDRTDDGIENELGNESATKSEAPSETKPATGMDAPWLCINPDGMTLDTRICTPEGYTRVEADADSLTTFLRDYPMKVDGSEVLLYDGSPKGNQRAHAAIFSLPIEAENLQQCADSVMRVYAEYCWHNGLADRIAFCFTNGFLAEYGKWRDGYRIAVNGNDISWTASAGYDDSYETFQKYMRMVFAYAGTLSMDTYESAPITLDELQVGDVFLKGGSPGHVVMVVDVCENESGDKAFLLGQGYMPAQEFHVIKNPAHTDDPWYYENEVTYPFRTPEYTFPEGSLRRLSYLTWTGED